ncbi:hypothetical protein [Kitasatospora sp. NPDC001095]
MADLSLTSLLRAASAAFTPTFHATVPEVLPAERDYNDTLSLSPLAYDPESLFSPALAAAPLALVSYDRRSPAPRRASSPPPPSSPRPSCPSPNPALKRPWRAHRQGLETVLGDVVGSGADELTSPVRMPRLPAVDLARHRHGLFEGRPARLSTVAGPVLVH